MSVQMSLMEQIDFDDALSDTEKYALQVWLIYHPPPDDWIGTPDEYARQFAPERVLQSARMLELVINAAPPTKRRRD